MKTRQIDTPLVKLLQGVETSHNGYLQRDAGVAGQAVTQGREREVVAGGDAESRNPRRLHTGSFGGTPDFQAEGR